MAGSRPINFLPIVCGSLSPMESLDRYWLDEPTVVPETAAILDELGVADSPAMKELDAEDCARLTAQMKKVPVKRFQRYLQGTPLEMIQEPMPMVMSSQVYPLCAHRSLTLFVVAAAPEDALQPLTTKDFNMSSLTVPERTELAALISAEVTLDSLSNVLKAAALPSTNPMPWDHRSSSAAATLEQLLLLLHPTAQLLHLSLHQPV